MNAARSLIGGAALVGAVLGIALDLASLVFWLRRNKDGRSRSGVSGASWILYLAYAMFRRSLPLLAGLTLFHASCHWIIPALHRWVLDDGADPG
ncbi:MAG: hypothetical protein KGJ84_00490 [Elusimicrobia bacterium]|nr:hypothetical protein [Elusimicrobiota bacterium]